MRRSALLLVVLSLGCTSTLARRSDLLLTRYQMYGFTGRALVAERGRVVLDKSYGITEPAFDAGSIMKTVVAAAALQVLDVRDPIGKYIDSLPPDRASITVEQLLLHTSGLPLDVVGGDVVRTAATAPLVAKPGERYSYSNTGYGLLALIIERATGEPFRTYGRRTLIEPAAMKNTSFWGEPSLAMPASFTGNSDEELERVAPTTTPGGGKYVFGAAGLITTNADLFRWWRFIVRRPELLAERAHGVSYGWNVRAARIYRGGLIHGSVMSLVSVYPRRDVVLTWMINKNTGWHEPLTNNFERILTGEPYPLPPAVIGGRDEIASRYEGIAITRDNDDLLLAAEDQRALSILWNLPDPRATNARVAAANPDCEVLGTARHPSAKSRLQTFLRCGGEITRVISDGDAIVTKASGYPRSAQRRFRRTGQGRYAMYDPKLDLIVELEVNEHGLVLGGTRYHPAPQ